MTDQPQSASKGDEEPIPVSIEEEDVDGLPVDLSLHLVARHADPGAVDREEGDNEARHHQEHAGPGTVRDHDEGDLAYDRERVWAVLREADDAGEPAPEAEDGLRLLRQRQRQIADQLDPAMPLEDIRRLGDRLFLGSETGARYQDIPLMRHRPCPLEGEEVRYPRRWPDAPLPSLDQILADRRGPGYRVYGRLMGEMLAGLEAKGAQRSLFITDPKATPADGIEMFEEDPEIFRDPEIVFGSRPSMGKSISPELAMHAAGHLDPAGQLAMHLIGVHADATAIDTDPEANMAFHHEEHEGGWDHPEGDLSYDPARVIEILAQHQEDTEDSSLSERACLALHLASGHHDDQAFFRTHEQNLAAHQAIPAFMHQHTDVQHRYEMALIQKIEADLADGTLMSWCPVPHPTHDVTDLARMIGTIYDQTPEMPADLIAVDLAWIKTAAWPWHRRLRAAALIAFPLAWPPSWYLDKRVRKFVRK